MADAKFISLNGQIVPFDEAKIHVNSVAVKYGGSVFEGVCGYWNAAQETLQLFRLDDHLRRLQFSMKVMRLAASFSTEDIRRCLFDVLAANDFRSDIHMRIVAYIEARGGMEAKGPVGLIITAESQRRAADANDGIRCCVSTWTRINDRSLPPRVKAAANYMNGRLCRIEAQERGFNEGIMLNEHGKIAEGSASCLFLLRGASATTPAVTNGILESITRASAIQILKERLGVESQERDLDRTELYAADEAFLCGSLMEIRPVVEIDGLPVGDGKTGQITRNLQQAYQQVVRGTVPDHPEWRTAVAQLAPA